VERGISFKGPTLELSLFADSEEKPMESLLARILYAEDDADTRELITVVLASRNC